MITPTDTATNVSMTSLRLVYVLSLCALVAVAGPIVRDATVVPIRGVKLQRGRALQVLGRARASQGHSSKNELWERQNEGRQEPLSVEDGPWNSETWSNSIALCATMSQENGTDVREWLQYYRWLGVDHVYLTENVPSGPPMEAAIEDFIREGFVSFEVDRRPQAQRRVYEKCVQGYSHLYNWMAFFDLDEFLVLRDQKQSLKRVLDDFKFFPGLAVHWVVVGPSGRKTRPTEGGVLRHYTQCATKINTHFKMIANTFYVAHVAGHPHNFEFRGMAHPVNENRYAVAHTYALSCPKKKATGACPLHPGHRMAPEQASVDVLALFHYATRSLEDFRIKQSRGGGVNKMPKPQGFYDYWARHAKQEGGICDEPSQLADLCCPLPPAP